MRYPQFTNLVAFKFQIELSSFKFQFEIVFPSTQIDYIPTYPNSRLVWETLCLSVIPRYSGDIFDLRDSHHVHLDFQ